MAQYSNQLSSIVQGREEEGHRKHQGLLRFFYSRGNAGVWEGQTLCNNDLQLHNNEHDPDGKAKIDLYVPIKKRDIR
ncbi:hypothetical protein NQ117_16585 [Paenibacillus sp. SC116]|nr:hypothetical protein [Paenibacillus sp. SC116]